METKQLEIDDLIRIETTSHKKLKGLVGKVIEIQYAPSNKEYITVKFPEIFMEYLFTIDDISILTEEEAMLWKLQN